MRGQFAVRRPPRRAVGRNGLENILATASPGRKPSGPPRDDVFLPSYAGGLCSGARCTDLLAHKCQRTYSRPYFQAGCPWSRLEMTFSSHLVQAARAPEPGVAARRFAKGFKTSFRRCLHAYHLKNRPENMFCSRPVRAPHPTQMQVTLETHRPHPVRTPILRARLYPAVPRDPGTATGLMEPTPAANIRLHCPAPQHRAISPQVCGFFPQAPIAARTLPRRALRAL